MKIEDMKINKFLFLGLVSLTALIVALTSFLSIENAQNCDQFVIDSYEAISGIDIPNQTQSQCFYREAERIRIGIYTISDAENFTEKYGFKPHNNEDSIPLWTQQYLREQEVTIPSELSELFLVQGDAEGNKWQCLVERNSGRMWFEVKWKD